MYVVDDARARNAAEVPAEVVALGLVDAGQRGETTAGEAVDLERLIVRKLGEVADVPVGGDHQMAGGVGELVQQDEGVLAAVENRYQRSQIQNAAHRYEQQIYDGTRPIIALNKYRNRDEEMPEFELARTPRAKQQLQVDRLKQFKKKNAAKAAKSSGRKGFGKKYDKNLADLPTDEATLKERQEHERFFKEMRKREF